MSWREALPRDRSREHSDRNGGVSTGGELREALELNEDRVRSETHNWLGPTMKAQAMACAWPSLIIDTCGRPYY